MSPLFTGSATPRVMACPASAVLPQVSHAGKYAKHGLAVHEYAQWVKRIGKDEALAKIEEEYRDFCESLDVEQLPDDENAHAEVSFAYNIETDSGRELGRDLGRAYPATEETEIPMTLDLVSAPPGLDHVIIWDYKSGNAPSAKDNWQLKIGALAACRAYKRSCAKVAIARIGFNGSISYDWEELDAFELDLAAKDLQVLGKRILGARALYAGGATVNVSTGPHCKYCPALAYCPAQGGLLSRFASEMQAQTKEQIVSLLTPETAFAAKKRLEQVESVVDMVKDALRSYASRTPIPVGNGKLWGAVETTEDELDPMKTFEVVSRVCGTSTAEKAVPRYVSKKGLKEAAAPVAKTQGKSWAALEREIYGALNQSGGIRQRPKTKFQEYDPTKKLGT